MALLIRNVKYAKFLYSFSYPSILGLTLRHTVSKYISVNFMSLCFSAASLHLRRKSPSDILLEKKNENNHLISANSFKMTNCIKYFVMNTTYIILALWTAVTLALWLFLAYSKAYSAMRWLACSVMSLILCTTPSTIWKYTYPREIQVESVNYKSCLSDFKNKMLKILLQNIKKCLSWGSKKKKEDRMFWSKENEIGLYVDSVRK